MLHSPHGMPASTHPPAVSLPAIKEADVPFSSLFDTNFDLATVEATAQLADKSIFVSSSGRRFLFETIPDDHGAQQTPAPTYSSPPQTQVRDPSPRSNFANFRQQQGYQSSIRQQPVPGRLVPFSHPSQQDSSGNGYPPGLRHESGVLTRDTSVGRGHINTHRFGAIPLYGESDGGVQAAETLTECFMNARSPTSPVGSMSPTQQVPPAYPGQPYQEPNAEVPVLSSRITNFNYGSYMAQAQAQATRQSVSSTGTLPSLMEYSSPIEPALRRDSSALSPATPISPYDEYIGRQSPHILFNGSPSPAPDVPALTPPQGCSWPAPVVNMNGYIDTQSAIVVLPVPQPTSSDGGSMTRDNVLPGEDVLFDGPVKSAATLASPTFMDGQLRVFRNTLSNDLRFHCKVGNDSETYWMKGANAKLVPVYAYDSRFPNVVYIRDTEGDKSNNYGYMQQNLAGSGRPSGIYQFPKLADLFDFQAKLTSEKVVLDIASVRLIRLSRMNSRSCDTYSSVRVQVWHEAEARRGKGLQSDGASFVTAGTALSGPLRERLVPQSSQLVVYLGRLNEYITTFITDDIDIKPDGPTMVRLKVRKAGTFSRRGSRWPGIKANLVVKQGNEPAALDIHGQATNPDIEASYDLYKTFEIDFESSPSQDNFLRKWDEVIKERRIQRIRLDEIQEDMEQVTFSGRMAREIW